MLFANQGCNFMMKICRKLQRTIQHKYNYPPSITAEQLLFLKINKIQQIELKSFCITPQTNSPPSLPITINNHEFDVYPSHPILTHCKHFHEKKMQYYLGYLKKVKYHMHHSVAHFSYSTLCF